MVAKGEELAAMPLAFGGMISLAASIGIGRFIYTPILPHMISSGIINTVSGGWIASANFFGYLVGALAAALLNLPGSQRFWFLFALGLAAFLVMTIKQRNRLDDIDQVYPFKKENPKRGALIHYLNIIIYQNNIVKISIVR